MYYLKNKNSPLLLSMENNFGTDVSNTVLFNTVSFSSLFPKDIIFLSSPHLSVWPLHSFVQFMLCCPEVGCLAPGGSCDSQ